MRHTCRIGPDAVQQAAILALGHCQHECLAMLLEEMQSLGDDSTEKAKVCSSQIMLQLICSFWASFCVFSMTSASSHLRSAISMQRIPAAWLVDIPDLTHLVRRPGGSRGGKMCASLLRMFCACCLTPCHLLAVHLPREIAAASWILPPTP